MRHLDLLTDKTGWHLHLHDFDKELNRIIAMHRYLVTVSEKQFTEEYERLMSLPGDGDYDGGDAIWDAEQKLGINPWDVASHAGLMAITRAISLSEVVLARMAAAHLMDPDHWVFPEGQLWFRPWEREFYQAVPLTPFKTDSNGFGTLRSLRDLYTHGYGIPATEKRRENLVKKLYNQFDTGPITAEETQLGYMGEAYFFGSDALYSSKTQKLERTFFMPLRADISPVATYRMLQQIRSHIAAAHAALSDGLQSDITAANNKFVAAVETWWDTKVQK
jgi:hypothetical protein